MKAMAVPLPSDNVKAWQAWVRECQGPRREEFNDFNERMGLTLHRAWLAESPQGNQVIVVLDGPGAEDFMRRLADAQEPFDRWFREKISELHEIDFARVDAAPSVELVMDWRAPSYVEMGE